MPEKIGLEAFVDVSKFSAGVAYYTASVDKMIFGTNRLSDAMEETAKPSVLLSQKIGDLGNKIALQNRQLGIYEEELARLAQSTKDETIQIERKHIQIDRLTQSIQKNTGTLNAYQQELEESRQGLKNVEVEAKGTTASLSRLDVVVGSFAGTTLSGLFQSAVSGGVELLTSLGSQALEAVASHESLTLAIETLTARELLNSGQASNMGDAMELAGDQAQELIGWIEELAVKSPFSSTDIASTFKLAQAYGFTSDEAQRLTQVLTDFTAGTGQAGYVGERLALALGQIQAKGKVSAQELNQLRETGLNVNAVLAEMGFTLSDVEKGYVKADQFIEQVVQTLERDFEGAAERQTNSWQGLISTLEDTKKIALREFFQGTFDAIQPLVVDFVETLSSEEFKQGLRDAGAELGKLAAAGVKLTQETDWGVIGRAFKDLAQDIASSPIEEVFNPKEALEAGARSYILLEADAALVRKLGEQIQETFWSGDFERLPGLFYDNAEAGEAFADVIKGLAREANALPKTVGFRAEQDIAKQPSFAGGGDSVQQLEQQVTLVEKLNDAFADYGETTEDINTKISKASQDYFDKEQDLLGELGDAQANRNNDRVEAYNEVTSELEQAESEFAEAVAEIGQQRLEVDKELNEGRLEADREFLAKSQELETELNNAILEAGRERAAAQAELNQGRAEAEAELLRELADLEREHAEESYDINLDLSRELEDFNKERLEAEEEFNRVRGELEEEHKDKVLGLTADILDAENASRDERLDIEEDYQDKLDDLTEKQKKKLLGIAKDIDEILAKADPADAIGYRTGEIEGEDIAGLSDKDKSKLQDLEDRMAEERKAFDDHLADLKEKSDEALQDEIDRNNKRQADLEERLSEENAAYAKAIEEQKRKYDEQEADRNLAHDRAVEDLQLRLTRENEEFDRQRAGLQEKYAGQLEDLQASYDVAVSKLDERLAKERIQYDEHRAALQTKHTEELTDLQTKHDDALAKLQTRLTQEQAEYAGQRADLYANYQVELADIETSYNDRVAVVREKLQDIAVANAEKQLELRAQMDDTARAFEESINGISQAWTGEAIDATKQYEDYLKQFHSYLEQTEFPVNIKLNIPEIITPGSPSPLEESLKRTGELIEGLNTLSLPNLSMPMMSTPVAPPAMVVGGGLSQVNQFGDINVTGSGASARDARGMARQAGGAVEGNVFDAIMEGSNRQEHNFRRNLGKRT